MLAELEALRDASSILGDRCRVYYAEHRTFDAVWTTLFKAKLHVDKTQGELLKDGQVAQKQANQISAA